MEYVTWGTKKTKIVLKFTDFWRPLKKSELTPKVVLGVNSLFHGDIHTKYGIIQLIIYSYCFFLNGKFYMSVNFEQNGRMNYTNNHRVNSVHYS